MFYCGLDIAGSSSFVFVTDARGKKVAVGPVASTRAALEARFKPFVRSGLAIAIEAGNQTAWIYEVLVGLGAQVTVVNPNKVKLIAESRRKTDKVDAKILCELLRLGGLPEPVHMPGKETRALRGRWRAPRGICSCWIEVLQVSTVCTSAARFAAVPITRPSSCSVRGRTSWTWSWAWNPERTITSASL